MHTHEYEYLLELDPVLAVAADDNERELKIRVMEGTARDHILPPEFECPYEVVIVEESGETIRGRWLVLAKWWLLGHYWHRDDSDT
jgi:hypothetical protein